MILRSQLLRSILGASEVAPLEGWDGTTTYIWFPPEDAIRIRIALMKGVRQALCPRCGTGLRAQLRDSAEPVGRVGALACEPCRHVIIVRLAEPVEPAGEAKLLEAHDELRQEAAS